MSRRQIGIVVVVALVLLGMAMYLNRESLMLRFFQPTDSSVADGNASADGVKSVVSNLETPWSISFLPGGDMLVSERAGQLRRVGSAGRTFDISGVRETSEGGLLGIALHPDFRDNKRLYLYYTSDKSGMLTNQVDVAELSSDRISNQRTILKDIPAATNHNGGAIEFGPDNKLYITTGDAAQEELAQDIGSLAGKILRINDDGTVPGDNPFGNLVWSYGHRNPQGIAWDKDGKMWSVEHGPSGVQTGRDELNQIEKGGNYGWPAITGDEKREGMSSPVLHSGNIDTWAPARMVFAGGKLYFTGLRGQSLYEVALTNDTPVMRRYFGEKYGRLRAIAIKDEELYIGTSNLDGRGRPSESDDQILKVPLSILR